MFLQMTLFPSFYWLGNISLLIPKASHSTAVPSGILVILLFASAVIPCPRYQCAFTLHVSDKCVLEALGRFQVGGDKGMLLLQGVTKQVTEIPIVQG